jgi:hypothetical protein
MIQPLLATWLTPKQILDTTTICDSHNPCLNIKAKYRTCALSYETCYTKVSNTFKQESGQHRRPMPGCTNCTEHTRVLKWHGLNAVSTVLVPSPLIIVCKPKNNSTTSDQANHISPTRELHLVHMKRYNCPYELQQAPSHLKGGWWWCWWMVGGMVLLGPNINITEQKTITVLCALMSGQCLHET